jgi:pyrroline-5-carboxylate reductase
MHKSTIAFIGGGNMARSLIGGLVADGWAQELIWVSDPDAAQRELMHAEWRALHIASDNRSTASAADVLVLAVKPHTLSLAAKDIAEVVQAKRPLVVSIAAGIRERDLNRWLGGGLAIVRCMPNTPALIQAGATAMFANPQVTAGQRDLAETILRAVGLTLWLEAEEQLDVVTAVSGSGPAYFFLVMQAIEEAGVKLGLARETARLLILQTAFGSAKMALESSEDAATLCARVTSKGGTTERAIREFQEGGMEALFERALAAAAQRSRDLADQLGNN